jgi:hypothetical protein
MIYYLISITVITLVFWGLHKAHIIPLCPICAGVVITWVGGAIALYYGTAWANPLIIAVLMGASMGALADKYGSRFGLFWKSSIVLLGLPAIYLIVQKSLWQGIGLVGIIIILTIFSNKKSAPALRDKKDLFKDCC